MPRYETREHDGGLVLQHGGAAHPHHDGPHNPRPLDYLQVMGQGGASDKYQLKQEHKEEKTKIE